MTGNQEISSIISEEKCNFTKRVSLFDYTRIIFVLTLDSWFTAFEEYGILKVTVIMVLTASTRKSSTVKNKRLINTKH